MIVTPGVCMGCPDEDDALFPQTITMMRDEVHRSDSKVKPPTPPPLPPPYELTRKSSSSSSKSINKNKASSSSSSSWPHGNWIEIAAGTSAAALVGPRSLKPLSLRKVLSSSSSSSSSSGPDKTNLKSDLEHKKSLWRLFRRRMNAERQLAIQKEREELEQIEKEANLILMNSKEEKLTDEESEQLVASLVSIDPHGEHTRCEVLLPKMFHLNDCGDKEKPTWSVPGGFWELWNMLSGQASRGQTAEPEGDTVSTSDETSLVSDFTTGAESQASWYSWQSAETQQVSNRGGTRELLMKHFGGENDSPWLAAQRGDLYALESRWKHRHDWTMEDEDGNTPLYYACRDGGAKNLRVVLFLLQQWPSTKHIPPLLLYRCKQDAANIYVQELLVNPCHAERIIQDFEKNSIQDQLQYNKDEDSEQAFTAHNLYDIFEDDDDDDNDDDDDDKKEKGNTVTGRPEF